MDSFSEDKKSKLFIYRSTNRIAIRKAFELSSRSSVLQIFPTMMAHHSDLSSAQRGYAYQDLTTAVALAELLGSLSGSVTVDKKSYPGDRFDDLIVRGGSGALSRQIKWSAQGTRVLELGDFIGTRSSVRIDHLVRSFIKANPNCSNHEYRLAVAWKSPVDPSLRDVIRETNDSPTIPGSISRRFRLLPERVWPEERQPIWTPLSGAPEITRHEFLTFTSHFVLETETPSFSGDLSKPGDLEILLFKYLVERIGIGDYPNERRTPQDVAARLIALATQSRTKQATLQANDVATAIDLRIDYGHVPQRFSINAEYQVHRSGFQKQLRRAIDESESVLVIGPPGSGKSWELSALADQLGKEGMLVARHYCYLEPGDPDIERRITTNTLIGNLIAELLAADPELVNAKQRTYAATLDELERILGTAAEKYAPLPVVLIVDGIDHISRVLAESRTVAAADTDIVEELRALSLAPGVRLVLGSQPGPHLEPFDGACREVIMQPWREDEVWTLAESSGLLARVGQVENIAKFLAALVSRADGNPLYATFLIRGLLVEMGEGLVIPSDWLESAPPLQGNIANYYAHLYRGANLDVQLVAEVLGVIDFAITETELGDIIGEQVARHLPAALRVMRPILIEITGRGGLRIFHESFRRFIVEHLISRKLSIDVPLARVIEWLEKLDFYENPKAYRYLLPLLRRANRTRELLHHVQSNFISTSLQWGHPPEAIERNLLLATEVAASEQHWPELVRFSELHRSLHTCFEEHLYESFPYWKAYFSLYGAIPLAERIVFDGRPTLDRHLGLVLCSLIDDRGEVAPWDEYLDLPRQPFPDRGGKVDLTWVGEVVAALFLGHLRQRGEEAALQWVQNEVFNQQPQPPVLRTVAERLVRSASAAAIEILLNSNSISPNCRTALLLARAQQRRFNGQTALAIADAEIAVRLTPSIRVACESLALGAINLATNLDLPNLDEIDIGLDGQKYHVEEANIAVWVTTVRILAYTNPASLERLLERCQGIGWYRSWLRYVLQISKAEVTARSDPQTASIMAVAGFQELANRANPFAGHPRAIDLVMARGTIRDTLRRGLELLRGDGDWATALAAIEKTVDSTAAHLQKTPWGPITRETLAELLEPYCLKRPTLKARIREAVETQVRAAEQSGEYFVVHAEIEFAAVRALVAIGDLTQALDHWRQAAVYLGAYGQRKDVTLYELLEGLPALDNEARFEALERLFPLADAVVNHTDGRSTSDLPNACMDQLAALDASAALVLAARNQVSDGGGFGWRVETASQDALDAAQASADPKIASCARSTFRLDTYHEPDFISEVNRRLPEIESLAKVDAPAAEVALRQLAARVEGDYRHESEPAWQRIFSLAEQFGLKLPRYAFTAKENEEERGTRQSPQEFTFGKVRPQKLLEVVAPSPLPPLESSLFDLLSWVRDSARPKFGQPAPVSVDTLVNHIGFTCLRMVEDDKENAAMRLLRFLSRQMPRFEENRTALADLGMGFERYGLRRLAAAAFALAFANSRGGGGWDSFGGDEHAPWLNRALSLDPEEARSTLGSEILRIVQGGYVIGVTPGIIKRIAEWGDVATAGACWDEAYQVVRHRLPSRRAVGTSLLPFRRKDVVPLSLNEAMIGLIISRVSHPELDRKRSALLAFVSVVKTRSEFVAAPLDWLLSIDGAPTSGLLLLLALQLAEDPPYTISRAIKQRLELLARSELYGERIIAKSLLGRAGLPGVTEFMPNSQIIDSAPEPRRLQAVLSLDWGDRIDAVSSLWPNFPIILCRRFQQLFENESSQEREKQRYEYASRRDSTMEFWTPIYDWHQELFEIAFQESLNGVKPYLWSCGENTIGLDEELIKRIGPNIRLQLAVDASRSVRPLLPRPTELQSEDVPIPTLPEDDELAGWRRLGCHERELVFKNPKSPWGNPEAVVNVAAGTIALPPGHRLDDTPFGQCDANVWFLEEYPLSRKLPTVLPTGFVGPLVGAERLDDPLGERLVLAPPSKIAVRYGLKPGRWPGRLMWVDDKGEPALMFRMWRVRSIEIGSQEPSILQGCELLARPDIFDRIQKDAANPLVCIIRPWRREVTNHPSGS